MVYRLANMSGRVSIGTAFPIAPVTLWPSSSLFFARRSSVLFMSLRGISGFPRMRSNCCGEEVLYIAALPV